MWGEWVVYSAEIIHLKKNVLIYRLQLDWGEHLKKENTELKCTSFWSMNKR